MTQPSAPRVLLVEDNDLNRALVRAVLARSAHPVLQGVTVVEANDLTSARTELAAASYDAILLDMQLPDGNGLDLARELFAEVAAPRPVVIALTASVMPEQQHLVLSAGCVAFLGKPYRPQELVDVLVAHLPAVDRP